MEQAMVRGTTVVPGTQRRPLTMEGAWNVQLTLEAALYARASVQAACKAIQLCKEAPLKNTNALTHIPRQHSQATTERVSGGLKLRCVQCTRS